MSVINFFQTADLFANLDLHWPPSWRSFVQSIAAVFNFSMPEWLSFLNPQCNFELAYFEKFILIMLSPFLLASILGVAFVARYGAAKLAKYCLSCSVDATTQSGYTHSSEGCEKWTDAGGTELELSSDGDEPEGERARPPPPQFEDHTITGNPASSLLASLDDEAPLPFRPAQRPTEQLGLGTRMQGGVEDGVGRTSERARRNGTTTSPSSSASEPEQESVAELAEEPVVATTPFCSRPVSPQPPGLRSRNITEPQPVALPLSADIENDVSCHDSDLGTSSPAAETALSQSGCRKRLQMMMRTTTDECANDSIECLRPWSLCSARVVPERGVHGSRCVCCKGSRYRSIYVGLLHSMAEFESVQLFRRIESIMLVYLLVGYVALVSAAMAPLGCQSMYGSRYMASQPTIECDWCESSVTWRFGTVSYLLLVSLAWMFTVLYGLGIPALMLYIMFSNSQNIKHREYMERYGFLSNKMREEWYAWEVVIIFRKFCLAAFTVTSGGKNTVRGGLLNLIVLLCATLLQFRYHPFCQIDANLAESFTLISTVLVLIIGLGQQASLAQTSQQHEQQDTFIIEDEESTQNVLDSFNFVCCEYPSTKRQIILFER